MPRVAVTGATGFIGRHVVNRLLAAGCGVNVLTRGHDDRLDRSGAEVFRGSLEDADALSALVGDVDAVVHAAGAVRAPSARHFVAVNAEATARLASAAARSDRKPRFILLSSLAAREPHLSSYAASKLAAEEALRHAGADLPWVALRPPAVYGPGDRGTLPLFRVIRRGLFPIPGNGRGRLSLIFVDDLVEAVFELLSNTAVTRQVLEIRDPEKAGYCWLDLKRAGEEAAGRRLRSLHLPQPIMRLTAAAGATISLLQNDSPMITPGKVREIYHRDWVCRNNPVAEQTAWRPRIGVRSGFKKAYDWYAESGWI